MERAFSPVNWILVITGCRLYPSKSDFVNRLDNIQAMILVVCHLIMTVKSCFPEEISNYDIVENIRVLLGQSISILFIIVMRRKRNQLRLLLKSIERSLTPRDLNYLFWYSIVISIPHCAWTLQLSRSSRFPNSLCTRLA